MPANQSTPEVTRADEARRLIEKLAGADIDVSGTAAIGITSADIIAANDWLSATPARGGDELQEAAQAMLTKRWASSGGEWGVPEWVETDEPRRFAEQILASTDMAGASVPDRLARRMGAEFVARDDVPPVEGLTSGEGRDKAIERAARYVLENSRRGNASLNSEQFDADTDKLMAAYRDIIGKAIDSGALASPKATATASVGEDDEEADRTADEAVDFVFDRLARKLGLAEWEVVEGSEEWEGDVSATLHRLLVDAGIIDDETGAIATLTDSGTAATIGQQNGGK